MPGPYGSEANPVVLDPFRRIVEVHWPERYTHVAFRWAAQARTDFVDDADFCTPATVGPGGNYSKTRLESVEYYFSETDGPSDGAVTFWGRTTAGAWVPLIEDSTVEGLPTLPPTFGHAGWQYLWSVIFGTDFEYTGDNGHAEDDLAAAFLPGSGSSNGIPIPPGGEGALEFQEYTPEFGYRVFASYTSSDAVCFTDGSVNSTTRPHDNTPAWIDSFPIPLESIVVTVEGRTYRGVAARQIEQMFGSVELARFAWILCELEEPTA